MGGKVLARYGRCAIRRFRRSDLQERLAWPPYTDAFFTHLNYDLSGFVEREKWLLARSINAGRMYFAVEDENSQLIGESSLREIDTVAKASRLGIHLASHKVDQGYGGEALSALLEHYFEGMRWNVMYLDVAGWNVRALRLYERLHFEHTAPFWRRVTDFTLAEVPLFTEHRYAGIRRFFRGTGWSLEGLYYDMAMTREHYHDTLRADAWPLRAVSPPPPQA